MRAPAHLPGESARSARSSHSVMNTRVRPMMMMMMRMRRQAGNGIVQGLQ